MFRNLLSPDSSSYIKMLPASLGYTSEEETKILEIESNESWTLQVKYNDN